VGGTGLAENGGAPAVLIDGPTRLGGLLAPASQRNVADGWASIEVGHLAKHLAVHRTRLALVD